MATKLTLTIEEDVISSAKRYARVNDKSLSGIVENYLRSLTASSRKPKDHTPQVNELLGAIRLPEDFDYKKELSKAMMKKYSR